MSLPGADPTPVEALEWALANTPGAAEEFARAEVARLRAIEVKFAACVGLIERLAEHHDRYCPFVIGGEYQRCSCDHDTRVGLRKLTWTQ